MTPGYGPPSQPPPLRSSQVRQNPLSAAARLGNSAASFSGPSLQPQQQPSLPPAQFVPPAAAQSSVPATPASFHLPAPDRMWLQTQPWYREKYTEEDNWAYGVAKMKITGVAAQTGQQKPKAQQKVTRKGKKPAVQGKEQAATGEKEEQAPPDQSELAKKVALMEQEMAARDKKEADQRAAKAKKEVDKKAARAQKQREDERDRRYEELLEKMSRDFEERMRQSQNVPQQQLPTPLPASAAIPRASQSELLDALERLKAQWRQDIQAEQTRLRRLIINLGQEMGMTSGGTTHQRLIWQRRDMTQRFLVQANTTEAFLNTVIRHALMQLALGMIQSSVEVFVTTLRDQYNDINQLYNSFRDEGEIQLNWSEAAMRAGSANRQPWPITVVQQIQDGLQGLTIQDAPAVHQMSLAVQGEWPGGWASEQQQQQPLHFRQTFFHQPQPPPTFHFLQGPYGAGNFAGSSSLGAGLNQTNLRPNQSQQREPREYLEGAMEIDEETARRQGQHDENPDCS
ncbi:MAG: hypothetical protein L6R39_002275 [Caloplaca ligustica]|nr:MAG: hypothetical protein L6R39_002275 [Caloplaca ligustica]